MLANRPSAALFLGIGETAGEQLQCPRGGGKRADASKGRRYASKERQDSYPRHRPLCTGYDWYLSM